MNQPVKKGSCGQNNLSGPDGLTQARYDSFHPVSFQTKGFNRVLPKIQSLDLFQQVAPMCREHRSVILGSGAPHRWTFGSVQHSKL